MLTCQPQSITSWTFDVQGLPSGLPAVVGLLGISEKGAITLGERQFTITRQGLMSGTWLLESDGTTVAKAVKPSLLRRRFEVSAGPVTFELQPRGIFASGFNIRLEGEVIGTLRRKHLFTRKVLVECQPRLAEELQLMALWLMILTTKRAADSSN